MRSASAIRSSPSISPAISPLRLSPNFKRGLYARARTRRRVLALAPKIILAIEGSGPPDAVEVLSRASVPFVVVPEGYDEASVLRKVRFIAQALGVAEKGEAMAKQIAEDFAAVAAMREKIAAQRSAVFVLAVGSGTPTVAGEGSSAQRIFKLAGVDNAIKGLTGFKPVTAEAALTAQPQAVVTLLERNQGLEADVMFALPAFAGTPAARDKRLLCDTVLLLAPRLRPARSPWCAEAGFLDLSRTCSTAVAATAVD